MDKFRIVFIGDGMTGWGGGIDYLCQMIGTFSYIDSNFDDISIDMHLLLREGFETSSLSDGAAILCNNVRKISDKISIHNLDIGDDWKAFIAEIDPDFAFLFNLVVTGYFLLLMCRT